MNLKSILPLVVTVFITVVLVAVTIIPIVEQAQHDQHSEMMNTGELYSLLPFTSEVTLSVSDNEPTLNGTKLSALFNPTVDSKWVVISDNLVARSGYTASNNTWLAWTVQSTAIEGVSDYRIVLDSNAQIVFADGTFTATNSAQSPTWADFTGTYSYLIVPDGNGTYGAFTRASLPKFVDSDSTIYVVDALSSAFTVVSGKITDLTVDMAVSSGSIITDATFTAVYTPTEYDASNSLTGFTKTGNISYTSGAYVLVPLKYTVIDDNQSATIAMLGIIPLLAILIPIMLIVRSFAVGRD